MARIEFNPTETIDKNLALEEAIMGQLRAGEPAKVSRTNLEQGYDVENEFGVNRGDSKTSATVELAAKCDAICTRLARVLRSPVEYDKEGDFIEFRMVTARPK